MDQTAQVVTKKLWSLVRMAFYMAETDIMSKNKIRLQYLSIFLKRGSRALSNLFLHLDRRVSLCSSLTCRSDDPVSPSIRLLREYEFSCSNTPHHRRNHPFAAHRRMRRGRRHHLSKSASICDASMFAAVERVLEALRRSENSAAAMGSSDSVMNIPAESPMLVGMSPLTVRQLRVTDSPFEEEFGGDHAVDAAAEEFIRRFYKDLKRQNTRMGALDSPNRETWLQ